ncbi:hypothetical protein M2243_000497 [Heliophilum fasciatum]|uniref:hypothetical protein n=1 Tax=Heliophilum fasciatum TaxID=35700 RepID=UPI002225E084|nr:hypothetical protein [Heliophilum fasciatum]MCW2277082.1 hypothetical protein [Heliophilum fasciatum]
MDHLVIQGLFVLQYTPCPGIPHGLYDRRNRQTSRFESIYTDCLPGEHFDHIIALPAFGAKADDISTPMLTRDSDGIAMEYLLGLHPPLNWVLWNLPAAPSRSTVKKRSPPPNSAPAKTGALNCCSPVTMNTCKNFSSPSAPKLNSKKWPKSFAELVRRYSEEWCQYQKTISEAETRWTAVKNDLYAKLT